MQHDLSTSFYGGIYTDQHIVILKLYVYGGCINICMMSLGNNNLVYMMVSKENVVNSQPSSDTQTLTQGQFPTYTVVTSPHTRVTQMMTNVAKPSLVSDIDNPVKSPVNKTSIISIVKGSGNSNQQIFVRKNSSDSAVESQNRNLSNDVQLIHPRTPVGENPNHHIFVRKSSTSSHELGNESQNRSAPSDSQVVHHTRIPASESFSQNISLNNQQAPPSYLDATQYTHREVSHPSFQVQSPYEVHRSLHSQSEKKGPKRHDSSRSIHHQGEKKVHIIHEAARSGDQQSDHKNQQMHESNRSIHQESKNHVYDTSRSMYQLSDQKSQQKHESIRSMQQHESVRPMQQHGEVKGQRIRESSHPMYHVNEQKNQQQIHYQLSDQKSQQLHESSQPLYLLSDQKNPQYESGRPLHQVEQKSGQQVHEPSRSLYQHSEQKGQQLHDSSRTLHQHEPKGQPGQHIEQKGQHESSRSSQHNDQKGQQIHVHKVHHGNARVKYVEFKPIQQGLKYRQMMHHAPRSYNPNLKQTLYYSNHLANSPGSHHLTVQTQTRSPLSPLHSPPALRPPPTIPSGTAWHSPPSLVPSPEVRPRFDFISSPQPITTAGSPCPVQVGNMVPHKMYSGKESKQMNISGNHNILLPRLPANYQLGSPNHQTSHANVPRSKATFIQTPSSNSPGSQPIYDNNQSNFSQSGIPSTSVATTVTVTMTYIPIPTSTKDKFVYVPVNSGQPVVLYQNQQPSGKPVLLPQQVLHAGKNVPGIKDMSKEATSYTTVRLQGLVNYGTAKSSNFTTLVTNTQSSPVKGMKYHLASTSLPQVSNHSLKKASGFFKIDQKSTPFNMDQFDLEKEKSSLAPVPATNKDLLPDTEGKQKEESITTADNSKLSNQGEVMTLINNQLRLVPPQVGVNNQTTPSGTKRNNVGLPVNNEFILQSPTVSVQEKISNEEPSTSSINDMSLETVNDLKEKKKRGRPPTEKITKKGKRKEKGKSKLSPMQGNLISALSGGHQDSNQVLIDTYRKQQQVQLQKHYFDDPLLKLPELSPTPESWTVEEVHKYLLSTDCACYADAIKAEEMDGKSFLLVTREALMDFLGVKLGPALKIAGHAAGLRARQRIYCLTLQEQKTSIVPKEKKIKLPSKTNLKPTDSSNSNNSIVSGDIPVTSVQNTVPADLVIPNISILPPPPDEKTVKPVECPPLITEPSPVILKVPNPLPLILGESCSTKLPSIEINGETPNELPSEEKNCSEVLPIADNLVIDDDNKNETEKIQIDVENISPNKLDLSHKNLSSSQIHALTENESNGITHESS